MKDQEASVRKAVVTAFKSIENPSGYQAFTNIKDIQRATNILKHLIKDQDKDVRILAIQTMGKVNQN
ncbi:MAG: hypothetical protein OXH36_00195 [Bdellovibrionales bacterium]|nr:hypothetical protein [Bdellovibrionales bacterium]